LSLRPRHPHPFSRRRPIRQLRAPPVERDDPQRELERNSIERLGELGDRDEIVAQPLVLDRADGRLGRGADAAQPRPAQVLLERVGRSGG
jgi:hypothetical protein